MLVPDGLVAVFGYGSLVGSGSIGRTVGLEMPPPMPARLLGHVPGWLVGSEAAYVSDRHWMDQSGLPFRGVIASLGLRLAPDRSRENACPGAVHLVPATALGLLHTRERDYRPVVRVAEVGGETVEVLTYLQKPRAESLLRSAVKRGRAVVTQEYLDIVSDAFAALGPEFLADYRRVAPAPPCPVVPLVFHEGPAPFEG